MVNNFCSNCSRPLRCNVVTSEKTLSLFKLKANDDHKRLAFHYIDPKLGPSEDITGLLNKCETLRYLSSCQTRQNGTIGFLNSFSQQGEEKINPIGFFFTSCTKKDSKLIGAIFGSVLEKAFMVQFSQHSLTIIKARTLNIDFLEKVVPDESDFLNQFLKEIFDFCSAFKVEKIRFSNVPESSLFNFYLNKILEETKKWKSLRESNIRWQRQLIDKTDNTPINHNSAKTRSKFRRLERRLTDQCSGDLQFRVIKDINEIDRFLVQASDIVDQTYHAQLGTGLDKNCVATQNYLSEMSAAGALRGYILETNGKAIAYNVGDIHADVFSGWAQSYLPEFKKYSPGIVLLNKMFESLINEKVYLFDFGYGDAGYKEMLGSQKFTQSDITIYNSHITPLLNFYMDLSLSITKRNFRKIVENYSLDHRFRRISRSLLQARNSK